MKLIVGLGNPGKKYEFHRHNLGFLIIDHFSQKFNSSLNLNKKFHGQIAQCKFKNYDLLLLKPETYMNNSGVNVSAVKNFYKLSIQDIIVIHDDIELKAHDVKIKRGGGNAGHNGLRSISSICGNDYIKLRYGIDRPPPHLNVSDYVLQDLDRNFLHELGYKSEFLANNLELLFTESPQAKIVFPDK